MAPRIAGGLAQISTSVRIDSVRTRQLTNGSGHSSSHRARRRKPEHVLGSPWEKTARAGTTRHPFHREVLTNLNPLLDKVAAAALDCLVDVNDVPTRWDGAPTLGAVHRRSRLLCDRWQVPEDDHEATCMPGDAARPYVGGITPSGGCRDAIFAQDPCPKPPEICPDRLSKAWRLTGRPLSSLATSASVISPALAVFTVAWKVGRNQSRVGAVEDPAVPAHGSGRVLISYAHDDPAHKAQVLQFYEFLRAHGVDALIDAEVAVRPGYWPDWMSEQIRQVGYVLVIGSPDYRAAAEDRLPAQQRKGTRWEARALKDAFYLDHDAARDRILPVLLPGRTIEDLPDWLSPGAATYY